MDALRFGFTVLLSSSDCSISGDVGVAVDNVIGINID
jgi:hypothetical protein